MPRTLVTKALPRALTALRGYPAVVLADAPVGYWRLNESSGNLQDLSGNGLTLTAGAGVGLAYRVSGLLTPFAGACMRCSTNTATALGTIADNVPLSITGNITLEAWIQRPNTNSGTWVILNKGQTTGSPTNLSYSMFIDSNQTLSLRLSANGSTINGTSAPTNGLNDTNIHHVVATYRLTGTVVALYIDGKQVKRVTTGPASIFDSTASFRVGAGATNADAATQGFSAGLIQEAAVYNAALYPNRIEQHYKMGRFTRSLASARSLVA